MKYKECIPIKTCVTSSWLITFPDRKRKIAIWHKDAKIEDIIGFYKAKGSGKTEFNVTRIDAGEFNVKSIDHSYSGDGRSVNQNMEVVIE